MDKHICKAKSKYDGSWMYGYYIAVPCDFGDETAHLIIEPDAEYKCSGEFSWNHVRSVDPDTVCRYTEMDEFVMTDRSVCTPLFEGDIVEVWSRRRPPGENIVLYRDNTTSKYDIQVKARAVICFKNGQWQLDYNNAYNDAICKLKGNEQIGRIVNADPWLYGFGCHRDDEDWWREHNQRYKWDDIIKIGNIHDNPELLEGIK